jgi:hypothetical protein
MNPEYRYFHDESSQTVYRMPTQADIDETYDKKQLAAWSIRMSISLVRADNMLVNNKWTFACGQDCKQEISVRGKTKEIAIDDFYNRHTPRCEEITEAVYKQLSKKYEAKASAKSTQ